MGESDELTDKAEEERLAIIARYDKGREDGAEIEPWDDPAFEIYHVTDHYGFIHDKRFPLKFNPEEKRLMTLEAERADKWIKMNANWDKYKTSEKLRKRTFKGIPNKVRGLFWGLFLDLPSIKQQQKDKYNEMYELARKHSVEVRQIDLDVNRTYRDHIMFRERYGVKQRSLFNILCAYSVYNSEVGYCQGMSQVAALLLTYMDEEDAFWGLSQLMSHHKYGMHGFFIAGFPKLQRFQQHHDKVLKTLLPKLKKHFDKQGVDVGLYTLKWFFQCFLDRVPFELALRLWDAFLMDGDKVLICGAYTILKIHQKQLLARKCMDDILDYMQTYIPSDTSISSDKVIEAYQKAHEELQRKKLDFAGESTEEELPKKPFGLIENIVKPVKVKENRNSMKVVEEVSKPQPMTEELGPNEEEEGEEILLDDEDDEEEEVDISEKASASHITNTSLASSSVANSPRNHNSRPLSSISNFSYVSAIEDYNSSNKSTPLRMNGAGSGGGNKDGGMRKSNQSTLEDLSKKLGNGSVESMEFIDNNALVISVSQRTLGPVDVSETYQKLEERSRSPNKIQIYNHVSPPPPPPRSPLLKNHQSYAHTHTTTITVVDKSHNGDKRSSSITRSDLDKCSNSTKDQTSSSSRISPISEISMWSSSSVSIPSGGGEAVRIHVPYNHCDNNSSPSPSSNAPPFVRPSSSSPRNNFDTLKNDPNRIKIDISSK